jgi:hypothetical protein
VYPLTIFPKPVASGLDRRHGADGGPVVVVIIRHLGEDSCDWIRGILTEK